ncbi:MAG: hypothetical protein JNK63_08670, partial [Chthonomonas sp.]|nr:hypothetical protein [Chthonomonas sp.]
ISLGSYLSAPAFLVATSKGRSFGASGSSANIQSYSTGQGLGSGSILANSRSIDVVNDSLISLSSTTLRKTDVVGGLSTSTTLSSSVTWSSLALFGNYAVAVGVNTSNVVAYQVTDITSMATSSVVTSTVSVLAGTNVGKAAFSFNPANPLTAPMFMYSYISTSNAMTLARSNFNSGVASSSVSNLVITNYSSATSMPAVLAGHGGWWVYGQDNTFGTMARIGRFDITAAGGLLNSSVLTMTAPGGAYATTTFFHPGMVVAPEPAAFLPLGLGMLLMRRRKRK